MTMTERVWIEGKFPTANDYINACRRNVHAGNKRFDVWTQVTNYCTECGQRLKL